LNPHRHLTLPSTTTENIDPSAGIENALYHKNRLLFKCCTSHYFKDKVLISVLKKKKGILLKWFLRQIMVVRYDSLK
jgi:hypothetical protein